MKPCFLKSRGQTLLWLAVFGFLTARAAAGEDPSATWPKLIETPQGRCTVFQPQPTALQGDRLTARAALAVAAGDSTNVVFGIAQVEARVAEDAERKQTTLSELTLTQTKFAPANAPAMAGLADALKPELAQVKWTVSAEELATDLGAIERERAAAQGIQTTPPKILYSSKPAALIVLDGPPQLRALTNSPLMRVVNTPYAMLFDPAEKRYWLQGSYEWFSAPDWRGEWAPLAQAPAAVLAVAPKVATTNAPAVGSLIDRSPRILVSTEPAELVVTRGEAAYAPVAGTDLLHVSNTDQLLFFTLDTKEYYVAFSGRWYRSPALTGPWDAVASDKLPPVFAKIAPGSPKSEALTYVAGTVEAENAVLQANIPQITTVDRRQTNVVVQYDGAPKFQPVENTGVQYAANTADAVFLVRDAYYVCRDAVWYSGPGPDGPWSVATSVPAEVQSLPPSNPHYNVKYVYVYGSTPAEVYVGYSPGYSGCYVYGPSVVYGTGWWYPGYYGPASYWAYPASFGFGFAYNSWCGWSVGVGFGYGWLGCGYGWGWGGCYPSGWWGPCGAYWATAPRYPCYGGHPPPPPGGHPPPPPGGQPPPPGGRPPPPSGQVATRSEPRRDAPGPSARPSNPQRRTLPEYARTAKAPYQPSTALRPTRSTESGTGVSGSPSRSTAPSRMEVANRPGSIPSRNTPGSAAAPATPTRAEPRTVTGPGSNASGRTAAPRPGYAPASASVNPSTRSPASPAQASAPTQPGRLSTAPRSGPAPASQVTLSRTPSAPANTWPGMRPNATGMGNPPSTAPAAGRGSSLPAAPLYARSPVSMPAPSRSWPGGTPSYVPSAPGSSPRSPSYGSAPVYGGGPSRSAMPNYGAFGGGAPMRAPSAAPSAAMRGGGSPSFSAPMRSGPAPSSSGFSGGGPSRGGQTR